MIDVMHLRLNQPFTLSPRPPGGEGRVRGADVLVRGAAHLTLPAPSLSPLKGGEGLLSPVLRPIALDKR